MHIVIVDNGRSELLDDPVFRPVLDCIRCGACLNVCPVYRQVGGHAYGWAYSGPIGAVLGPLLGADRGRRNDLAWASSLCLACTDACPVKVPLHDMLLALRQREVASGRAGMIQGLAFRIFALIAGSPALFALGGRVARILQSLLPGGAARWIRFGPMAGWTRYRTLPPPPPRAFRELWDSLKEQGGAGRKG